MLGNVHQLEADVPNKLLSPKLDTSKLSEQLQEGFYEFQMLRSSDRKNFEAKLKNSGLLLTVENTGDGFAPIPWLLARIAGASWAEKNYRNWIRPPHQYWDALRACGFARVGKGDARFERYRHAYYEYCRSEGFEPSLGDGDHQGSNREIWVLYTTSGTLFPEEISEENKADLWEGAAITRFVNVFERNSKARAECVQRHGKRCKGCNIDFEEQYGELGRGFIHVHHVVPISGIKSRYQIDPIKDLIPLCPNCHAMIHKQDNPADIEGLRRRISRRFL